MGYNADTRVYWDIDGDGGPGPDEPGLPGLAYRIFDTGSDTTLHAGVTDAEGRVLIDPVNVIGPDTSVMIFGSDLFLYPGSGDYVRNWATPAGGSGTLEEEVNFEKIECSPIASRWLTEL
jgi:hypothetical protein